MSEKSQAELLADIGGFTRAVGIESINAKAGRAELTLALNAEHLNSGGIVHGGVLATLLDCAAGAAVFNILPHTQFAPTTNMSISYISAVGEGLLTARAKVLKQGRRMVYCDAKVLCGEKLLATAQLSFMVMDRTSAFNAVPPGDST